MKVVREGRIEEATSLDMGPLVYLNDAHFEWFMRWERTWERIYIMGLAACELILMLFWIYIDFHSYGLLMMVLLPVIGLLMWYLAYGHLHRLDSGIAVHQNGVDMVNVDTGRVWQVFVPWDEIEDIFRDLESFGITLRHTGNRLRCNANMVDEYTEHAIRSMSEQDTETDEPPDLHVYPRDGRKTEGVHAPGSPK